MDQELGKLLAQLTKIQDQQNIEDEYKLLS